MSQHLIVVQRKRDLVWVPDNCTVVPVRDYITQRPEHQRRGTRIINLCHDYSYLSLGYYCSLLAEGRGEPVIPAVEVLLELGWKRLYSKALPEFNAQLVRAMADWEDPPDEVGLRVYFGEADQPRLQSVARRVFDVFRCPILEITIRKKRDWEIAAMRPLSVRSVHSSARPRFRSALDRYTRRRWRQRALRPILRYRLAVLHNPAEKLPPSDPVALRRLARAGAALGVQVELITRHDYPRLGEFDALFIRETTALDHHTFRFAHRAAREGIPVIDDPISILRCANKVYLAEIFHKHRVPTPSTIILERRGLRDVERQLGYPVILKIPDGSFSRGVFKADDREALERYASQMWRESDVILAQEFMPTRFDWRIGILGGEPLFACQYNMSGKHWQIIRHRQDGGHRSGGYRSVALEEVPEEVLSAAIAATKPIGDGLYGVDVKETPDGAFVIEVNDNPNIDADVEDQILRGELYRRLIAELIGRIEQS